MLLAIFLSQGNPFKTVGLYVFTFRYPKKYAQTSSHSHPPAHFYLSSIFYLEVQVAPTTQGLHKSLHKSLMSPWKLHKGCVQEFAYVQTDSATAGSQ